MNQATALKWRLVRAERPPARSKNLQFTFPELPGSFEYLGMRYNYLALYVHIVWATYDRNPLIDERKRSIIYQSILNESRRLNANVCAIGGIEDHVHVLVEFPATIAVGDLVKQLKGKSSWLCGPNFKWQGSYSALSVCQSHLGVVSHYVENQENHHRIGDLIPELEITEGAFVLPYPVP